MSFDAAASIPLGLGTASIPLYSRTIETPHMPGGSLELTPPWVEGGLDKHAGQPFVVLGGSSSVGQLGTSKLFRALQKLMTVIPVSHPAREAIWILTDHYHGVRA